MPGLDDVIELGLEGLAAVELRELGRGVVAGWASPGDQGLQLLAGGQGVEGELDPGELADGGIVDLRERALEEPGDLVADGPAVAAGHLLAGPVFGVGVGPAA